MVAWWMNSQNDNILCWNFKVVYFFSLIKPQIFATICFPQDCTPDHFRSYADLNTSWGSNSRVTCRGRRYGIFSKNEYFYWMNNQIIFWMNKFFEWIFLLYYWMNLWMNQKSAIFIKKMNKKCVLCKKNAPFCMFFHSFSLFFTVFSSFDFFPIWMNNFIEWIFLIQFWIEYWIESFFGPIQRKNE